jgi:hypothetical protein
VKEVKTMSDTKSAITDIDRISVADPDLSVREDRTYVERFTPTDLITLRDELLQSGVDSFQAAHIVMNFLSGRGYGVSSTAARTAASKIESPGCTPEHIQAELEAVALAM